MLLAKGAKGESAIMHRGDRKAAFARPCELHEIVDLV